MTIDAIFKSVKRELEEARSKFPGNEKRLAAFNEEAGELTKAMIDHHYGKSSGEEIVKEAIQVIAMAVRLIHEGDQDFNFKGWGIL